MAKIENLKESQFGLVQKTKNGISQIGLTESQSTLLHLFISSLSKDSPFVLLPSEYDLELKNN